MERKKIDENSEDNSTPMEIQKDILPGYATFDDYSKDAFAAIKAGIKSANSLPSGENFNFWACIPKFNNDRNKEMKNILDTMQKIIKCSGAGGSICQRDNDEKFDLLAETNDIFIDRANICMDKEDGIKKEPAPVEIVISQGQQNNLGSWNTATTATTTTSTSNDSKQQQQQQQLVNGTGQEIRLFAGKNIQRPQLLFKDKIDNSSNPWQPRIKDKPNSLKPLEYHLIDGENGEIFSHPYEFELEKFNINEKYLVKCKPIKYKSLDDTPLIFIENTNDLNIMLNDLIKYNELAIDLEHHSYRTYQGITCLMQISTRDTDYLIDTLTLRSDLHVLNEILTKPTVLKVFHGADSDIQWLQRDLSLYIVNMFDTHQAAKHLNLPYLSLAYLLKIHCNVDPNKHFQLADWRMRPLPNELMKYAREDTHYLLYIKDILNNQLIDFSNGQTNILKAVYDRSTEVCKKLYEKPVCNVNESYMNLYRKSRKMFNTRQLYALKEIFNWRDKISRQEDDSTGYVLPNHMLLNIAETLPREMQGILACCNPIPPMIRQHQLALHKIVLEARSQPLIKPILEQDIRQRFNQRNQTIEAGQDDVSVWTSCDIPNGTEIQENLPCLLDSLNLSNNLNTYQINHTVTIFDSPSNSDNEDDSSSKIKLQNARKKFVSPFERYKLVIPMVAAQEAKDRALKEKQIKEKAEAIKASANQTNDSINRVREHFIQVTQNTQNIQNTPVNKTPKTDNKSNHLNKLSTPMSAKKFGNKRKRENDSSVDRFNNQHTPNGNKNKNKNYPNKSSPGLRQFSETGQTRKEMKAENRRELEQKGMLPQAVFDYKSVDFNSFQGGSKKNPDKITTFQQQKFKDKIKKGKKRKKEKLGI